MYMYGGGVHLVRPLDGEAFNPCSLRCCFINSVIDKGVCVMLYDGLEWEEQLKLEGWWAPPFFAALWCRGCNSWTGKGDDLVSAVVLKPVLS